MAYLFLSYSKADRDTAFAIREVLQKEGFDVWMDENVHGLNFWHGRRVQKYIREAWALVVLVSDAARKAKALKNQLTYAQRIKKQIFQIVIEGEGWEGLDAEILNFGLGLRLDISDEEVKKLKYRIPLTDKKPIPPQIPGDKNLQFLRYLLNWAVIISIIMILLWRVLPGLRDSMKNQNTAATAELATSTALDTTPTQSQQEIQEMTAAAVREANATNAALLDSFATDVAPIANATGTVEAHLAATINARMVTQTEGAILRQIPCSARPLFEEGIDTITIILFVSPNPMNEFVAFEYSQDDNWLRITAMLRNDFGIWYQINYEDEQGRSYTGYVLDSELLFEEGCPR